MKYIWRLILLVPCWCLVNCGYFGLMFGGRKLAEKIVGTKAMDWMANKMNLS